MGILTEQELGVLQIHAQGGNVAAVGHWEKPVDHMVALGLLKRHDKHNHSLTPAGEAALEADEREKDAALGRMIEAGSVMGATQKRIREFAEQAAQLLAQAAQASNKVVGDDPDVAVRKWANIIVNRALEILRG